MADACQNMFRHECKKISHNHRLLHCSGKQFTRVWFNKESPNVRRSQEICHHWTTSVCTGTILLNCGQFLHFFICLDPSDCCLWLYLFLLYLFLFVLFIANSCREGFVGLFAGACVWEYKSRYIISLSSIWRDDSHMQCWGVSVCIWPLHSGHLPLWWRWRLRGLVWWVGLL